MTRKIAGRTRNTTLAACDVNRHVMIGCQFAPPLVRHQDAFVRTDSTAIGKETAFRRKCVKRIADRMRIGQNVQVYASQRAKTQIRSVLWDAAIQNVNVIRDFFAIRQLQNV